LATENVPLEHGVGFMKASSKKTYASKVKEAFKDKFPHHEYWNDVDNWKVLLSQCDTQAQRTEQQGGQGGVRKGIAIFKDLLALPFGTIGLADLGVNIYDLKSIFRELLKEAKNEGNKMYQKRFEIILCNNADGRGGEHFLIRWSDAHWDARFNMPDFS
jgi:hypothetical protein